MVTIIPQTTAIITMNPAEMVSKRRRNIDSKCLTVYCLDIVPKIVPNIVPKIVPK